MKRLLPVLVVISYSLLRCAAFAQNQQEMNQTAESDFEKADARLNAAYKKVLAKEDEDGKKKLIAAEKAWVAYRDAEADYEADSQARGGSMEPMIYSGTEATLTEDRIKQLQAALKDLSN
jgi:uncharacterized protein YecT (DUF1311 family)